MVLNKEKIKERILELVELYETDKAFVEACGITNMAFVTNIKKGKNSNPGALYIAQIVRGTGVNPYWLLLGEGEMFEDRKGSYTDTKGVDDTDLVRGLELIQRIERKTSEATGRTIRRIFRKRSINYCCQFFNVVLESSFRLFFREHFSVNVYLSVIKLRLKYL